MKRINICRTILLVGWCTVGCASASKPEFADQPQEIRAGMIAYAGVRPTLNLREKPDQQSKVLHPILFGQKVSVVNAGRWEKRGETEYHWFQVSYGEWQGWVTDKDLLLVKPEAAYSENRAENGCYQFDREKPTSKFTIGCFGSCNSCGELSIRLYNAGKVAFVYGCHYGGYWQGRWHFDGNAIKVSGVYAHSGAQYYYDECGGVEDMMACMLKVDNKFKGKHHRSSIRYKMTGTISIIPKNEGVLNLTAVALDPAQNISKNEMPFTHKNQNIGCAKDISEVQ